MEVMGDKIFSSCFFQQCFFLIIVQNYIIFKFYTKLHLTRIQGYVIVILT